MNYEDENIDESIVWHEEKFIFCIVCHKEYPSSRSFTVDEGKVCRHCYHEYFTRCDECKKRVRKKDIIDFQETDDEGEEYSYKYCKKCAEKRI